MRIATLGMACGVAAVTLLSARATGRPIAFRDVAAASGITFRLEHHPTPEKRLVETMPGGLAAFDYNGDGRRDLYFTNGAPGPDFVRTQPSHWNRLYRNDGGMTFTDVTEAAGVEGEGYSMGAAAADYDNDGDVDLFVAGYERNLLYRNDGRGAFHEVAAASGIASRVWSVGGAWLDYDADGRLDLFVVNYLKWSPRDDRFCGDRARGIRVYCHPRHYEGLPNTLYRNRGDGTFEDVSGPSGIGRHVGKGMSAATADYDRDGRIDIFVTNDTEPNFLFRNLGNGRFEETALLAGVAFPIHGKPISSMGTEFHDYDNDGLPDIHVTALAGETFPLFRNEGGGQFSDWTTPGGLAHATVKRSGWSNLLADFDNDGWKDLFTANSHVNDRIESFEAHAYREPNSLFRNAGNGRFQDVSAGVGPGVQTPRAHRGAIAVDLNDDGRLDIVTTSLGDRIELWENRTARGNRWIAVRLTGTRSNRDGIGAEIRVGSQLHTMTTAVGYVSSVHDAVHFGVGDLEEIDRIEILWPSGTKQVLEKVKTNQVVTAMES